MRTLKKSGVTALTAGIALAIGAVPVAFVAPAIVASGEGEVTVAPAAADAGTITLATTPDKGIVTWNGARQEFAETKQCEISMSDDSASLLDISGSVGGGPGTAGFRGGSIGVFEFTDDSGPSNASQCFRVDADSTTPSEELTLALGDDVKDGPNNLIATSVSLSVIAQSRQGKLVMTLSGPGGDKEVPVESWKNIKSGDPITEVPDVVGEEFTAVSLRAERGSFSLVRAEFDLQSDADFIFDCQTADSYSEGEVDVRYLGNADGEDCRAFGIKLDPAAEEVGFFKRLDVNVNAQFTFEIDWDLTGPLDDPGQLPSALIDFENYDNYYDFYEEPEPTVAPLQEDRLPFCPDWLVDENGIPTGFPVEGHTYTDLPDWRADLAGRQYACIGSRESNASKTGGTMTDQIYVMGDARMRL